MSASLGLQAVAVLAVLLSSPCVYSLLYAMDRVRTTTRTDEAVAKYGLTGKGVTIAIMDRGIDWRHPDFIKPDGTTRIKWILDMTGQNSCDPNNPPPVEYTEAQINAALSGGPDINHRDAVGHGTVTAGLATGNGRAFANGKYHGMAPEADLVIVKLVGGAPAHDNQPEEPVSNGCLFDALDWVNEKIGLLGQPAVAIANIGVQWGPLDGTSSESRKIDQIFGLDRPGRVYATGTGDEGSYPTHSGGTFDQNNETVVNIFKATSASTAIFAWYTGNVPAEVTITFDDGTTVGPIAPGVFGFQKDGITVWHYLPGTDPWQSTSGDRLIFFNIDGHIGHGSFRIRGLQPGIGHFDLYTPAQVVTFLDHLVPGRINNLAVTQSAVVAAVEVNRNSYVDIDGILRDVTAEGTSGDLWLHSSDGPTRDGRLGVDVTVASHYSFAAYGPNTHWASLRHTLIQDGGGWYGGAGAASASGPVMTGAVALMLQLNPGLTARQIKQILHDTAVSDSFTGPTPNTSWGYGKLDMVRVLDAVAALPRLVAAILPSSRSVQLGTAATAFATIINAGSTTATECGLSLLSSIPATFSYQTTNPATNQVIGSPNTPADIPAGALQTYIFAITPNAPIAPTDVQISFSCANTAPAQIILGLNTLSFSASTTPIPDIVALGATPTNDGIVNVTGSAGTGAFAVSTVNVGASGSITASVDTGSAGLPVNASLCQTNPTTGACLSPPSATVTTTINAGATPTFGIFVHGTGDVPFDPAANRVFVRFKDDTGVTRGSTSVAVRTQP